MPIQRSRSDESNDEFIQRCMGDETMLEDYTDADQRFAVCLNALSEKVSEADDQEYLMEVRKKEDSHVMEYAKDEESGDAMNLDDEDYTDEDKSAERLEVASEIKAVHENDEEYGVFEGYGSIFNNTDLGNDVVQNGAFLKSLKKTGAKGVKLLYQHKTDMPIGVFDEIEEDKRGLKVKGRLALKTQAGAEAYELMKMGALDGLSIGFRISPSGQSYDAKTKRRMIKEVELMEISLVTFPMNPKAKVRSVKGAEVSIREWENGLRDVFHLSRSEAKVAAKAVHEVFTQRDVDEDAELAKAVKSLTRTLEI